MATDQADKLLDAFVRAIQRKQRRQAASPAFRGSETGHGVDNVTRRKQLYLLEQFPKTGARLAHLLLAIAVGGAWAASREAN